MLPVAGPLFAVLIGADLRELYASSLAALASVVTGLALTAVGWLWSRDIVERASRPRAYPDAEPLAGRTPS